MPVVSLNTAPHSVAAGRTKSSAWASMANTSTPVVFPSPNGLPKALAPSTRSGNLMPTSKPTSVTGSCLPIPPSAFAVNFASIISSPKPTRSTPTNRPTPACNPTATGAAARSPSPSPQSSRSEKIRNRPLGTPSSSSAPPPLSERTGVRRNRRIDNTQYFPTKSLLRTSG